MIRATVAELCAMIPGATCVAADEGREIRGVCTDSRSVVPGSLFVPIIGERFDGHSFARQAADGGAAAVLWAAGRGEPPQGVAAVYVRDTLEALQQLAASYRLAHRAIVVAVTGSNGKTTTKDMAAAALSARYNVHKTEGNLNNHIGLPLTLLAMDESTEAAVVEMGMSGFGEIELLSRIARPDAAIITNIGEAHMLQLGSRENIATAKLEVTAGLRPGGLLLYPADEPLVARRLQTSRLADKFACVGFGGESGRYRATSVSLSGDGSAFTVLDGERETAQLAIPLPGRHNVGNALAVYALAAHFGASGGDIAAALRGMKPTGMRFEKLTADSGLTIYNDAYNANPSSVRAAIALLRELSGYGRKAVALGDMLELGADEERYHREIGRLLAEGGVDYVFTYGRLAAYIAEECRERLGAERVEAFMSKPELTARIAAAVGAGDALLVKGSRGNRLEDVIGELMSSFHRK